MQKGKLIVLAKPLKQSIFGGSALQKCRPIAFKFTKQLLTESLTNTFQGFCFNFGNTFLKRALITRFFVQR